MHQRKDELQCEVIPTATAPDMHLVEMQEAPLAGGRAERVASSPGKGWEKSASSGRFGAPQE